MYKKIESHPTVREQYAARARRGRASSPRSRRPSSTKPCRSAMRQDAHEHLKASIEAGTAPQQKEKERLGRGSDVPIETAVDAAILRELNDQLLAVPEGFTDPSEAREAARAAPRDASARTAGSTGRRPRASPSGACVVAGTPIRLTGQDTERGTFSHRHLVLHDYETGRRLHAAGAPARRASAPVQVYNSPLSEMAAARLRVRLLGRLPAPRSSSGRPSSATSSTPPRSSSTSSSSRASRSGTRARGSTLLLPHGYEGNGPEHSSARLERFMQLAAQENIRIVNCTTAAQYFHVLRRQALHPKARPLVLLTPKGLLRLKESTLQAGRPRDAAASARCSTTRARRGGPPPGRPPRPLLGQGLLRHRRPRGLRRQAEGVAVARLEQLYPFPVAAYDELLSRYPNITELDLGAGGAAEHGRLARHPPPARGRAAGRGAASLRRPPVAREPERGLPDRARARAGPDRPRGACASTSSRS